MIKESTIEKVAQSPPAEEELQRRRTESPHPTVQKKVTVQKSEKE
jgi:hypothetical protein